MNEDVLAAMPEVCLKLFLALLLSGIVGLERERQGRAAGLRTHILVCLGATLTMIVGGRIAAEFREAGAPNWLDTGRIAAGVITGVGFLGAGTIINVGSTHRGLTTAAMIWFVAALGIAIGCGYYLVAGAATAFALFTVICLRFLTDWLPSHERFSVSIRMPGGAEQVDRIENAMEEHKLSVMASRLRTAGDGKRVDMTFEVVSRKKPDVERLVQELQDRFKSAERILIER